LKYWTISRTFFIATATVGTAGAANDKYKVFPKDIRLYTTKEIGIATEHTNIS
jgi:hypothetical protein